jgi:hypothetical protein
VTNANNPLSGGNGGEEWVNPKQEAAAPLLTKEQAILASIPPQNPVYYLQD